MILRASPLAKPFHKLQELSKWGAAHGRFTDEDVLAEFHSVVKRVERIPSLRQFDAYAQYASSAIIGRFGGIQGIVKRYKEWLMENEPNSPCLRLVANKLGTKTDKGRNGKDLDTHRHSTQYIKEEGILYGAPLNFRGLRHAPVNEQGVVYLFGMVAYDLGIVVESIQAAFPDCEAKRCVDSRRNLWQRIMIEFEYLSSNFRSHKHNAQKCNLIVCWHHDWPDCPLEVIELRSVLDGLKA